MLTVVLIDDDPISTFVTEKLIEKNVQEPVRFFKFSDPKKALIELRKIRPNFLFLDLNMPEMDGWSFLDSLNGESKDTNIYILSSSVDERDINRAASYKMVKDYLAKPLVKTSISSIFH